MSDEEKEYLEQLNDYYKLKSNYENSLDKEKNQILKNTDLSWKEKRREYKELKYKCINCRRPVGSIFSTRYDDKQFTRVLKAKCGDLQNPCDLDIIINVGYYDSLPHIIQVDKTDLEELKLNIIKEKNNLLFNYISTEKALENFDKNKTEIMEITSSFELSSQRLFSIEDDPKKQEEISRLQTEYYILVNEIKGIIKEFEKTNNTQLVHDAVLIYVNQLSSKIKEILNLKYVNNYVDYHEDDDTYHLIQDKYNIKTMEYDYYGEPNVEKFVMGGLETKDEQKTMERKKTSVKSRNPQISKKKTEVVNKEEKKNESDNNESDNNDSDNNESDNSDAENDLDSSSDDSFFNQVDNNKELFSE